MKIILLDDVSTLGRRGDVRDVADGYARNYLLPNRLAVAATEGNKKRIAAETRVRSVRNQAERTEAERFAAGLFDEGGWERTHRLSEAATKEFGGLVARGAKPIDDVRGTAVYRRHVLGVMGARALARVAEIT